MEGGWVGYSGILGGSMFAGVQFKVGRLLALRKCCECSVFSVSISIRYWPVLIRFKLTELNDR